MEVRKEEIITTSATETAEFAKRIAEKVKHGGVVLLSGDLGSGKTTFTQGFAKGLGITHPILSPSFIIVRKYELPEAKEIGEGSFYHIDLYRIETEKEIEGVGLKEIFENTENIVVIEWAEKLGKYMPEKRWELYFEYLEEEKRRISIKSFC